MGSDTTRAGPLRWTGFAGAVLLTGGAWAVLATAPPAPAPAPAPVLAAGVTGTGLLVLAWAMVGRRVLRGAAPPVAWSVRTLALWATPLLFAPPLFSRDVYSYLAQGEIAHRGLDPHLVGPRAALGTASGPGALVDGHWVDAPSPYGPLFTASARIVAALAGGGPVAGVALHRLAAVAGLVLLVAAVPRLCALSGASPAVAMWLGPGNPLVLLHLVGGVHNDALMLGLGFAGTALALEALDASRERIGRARLGAGVLLVSLGALVKLPVLAALAVIGTALARRRGATSIRRRGGAARQFVVAGIGMAVAFAAVASAVSVLTGAGLGWTRSVGTPGTLWSWMAPTNWSGFAAGALAGADVTGPLIAAGRIAGAVFTVAGIAFVLYRQLRGRIDAVPACGAVLGLIVLFGPVLHPWYLLWAVLPLAASPLTTRARTGIAAVCGVFAVLLPPLAGDHGDRPWTLVVAYATAVLVAGAVLPALLHRDRMAERAGHTGRPAV
ncbi:polyprenol phosphomannose-dependent alpha 1,6 mannosyltransferase MptB [Pseudonocardia sp. NPDC049635]|uniref:polyprenol phosphomannose-dependent alpha 1,6 mannosyltransferase MptB n=1 Tax=Pseudonocardia sp. NPDC049635 TaxID=3155506 RepID=UPI0033E65B27